ncbi:amidase [Labrys wisconsinensis]|uniref:Amidase n=1 Tax=Labrys wisconsinensis TaxID=425677 RepID=A0ABU0J093_9HYPH|nr:amidase [Labrys wisconsinensis]
MPDREACRILGRWNEGRDVQIGEYASHDALGLAALVARREVHPAELLDAALAAVDLVDGSLNAVVATFAEEARRHIAEGLPEGPFRGVPFLLKDLTAHYAGQPTGSGWPPRLTYAARRDTTLVARYKAAGLSIFGKTAVPELAMNWSTESSAHGATRNPWDLARTAGTSSGGSAAAVAAGIVPMAHGNDGGGSIRVPASCCGVFGLKPSRGRNPVGPAGDLWQGMLVEHALTRSVRDSAALLDATAGPEPGQFFNSPAGGPFLPEVGRDPGRLRVAVSTKAPYGAPTHPDCIAAVAETVMLLESLGHACEPAEIDLPETGWYDFETFILAEYAAEMRAEAGLLGRPVREEDFPPTLWHMIQAGERISAVELNLALSGVHRVAQAVASLFGRYDVILSPTLAQPPVPLGSFSLAASPAEHFAAYLAWMPFTHVFNVSGSPAMSVPLVWNEAGLPIGVQFAAAPQAEATLLRLAGQLEQARPWAGKRPPVSVAKAGGAA